MFQEITRKVNREDAKHPNEVRRPGEDHSQKFTQAKFQPSMLFRNHNMNPTTYFNENLLWDREQLRRHCVNNGVDVITSTRFPSLVMLHYDAVKVHFADKWTPFNRMCRGLIMDMDAKKMVAHPFDKFFNLGEQPSTTYESLLPLGPFDTTEKLDGSMVVVFKNPSTDEVVATTKGSFDNEHGAFATAMLPASVKSFEMFDRYTLVFELIHPQFQIVIDYRKKGYAPGLYLIGVRDHARNKMVGRWDLELFAQMLQVPFAKVYTFDSLDHLLDHSKSLTVLEEGFVLYWCSSDLLVKVKGAEYLQAHRFISHLSQGSVLDALVTGNADQMLALAPEEYRAAVETEIGQFRAQRDALMLMAQMYYAVIPKFKRGGDFASWVEYYVPNDLRSVVYALREKKRMREGYLYERIKERNHITYATRI